MNDISEFLLIFEYEHSTANRRQLFGIRGQGKEYSDLWKNLKANYKLIYDSDDWPWSYVAFSEDDEKRFREEYGKIIVFQENRHNDQPYDCVLDRPKVLVTKTEKILDDILREEIQKQINMEIIAQINGKSK